LYQRPPRRVRRSLWACAHGAQGTWRRQRTGRRRLPGRALLSAV